MICLIALLLNPAKSVCACLSTSWRQRIVRCSLLFTGALGLLSVIPAAYADDSQPLFVEIVELKAQPSTANTYAIKWRLPATLKANNLPSMTLPQACGLASQTGQGKTARVADPGRFGLNQQHRVHCKKPIAGRALSIQYARFNPSTSSLIKYRAISGETHTRLLAPNETSWAIPSAETPSRIAYDYTVLGMQHIWAGTDHLLFLLCLLWIAGGWRRVLITITGFTVAHSITLVLSALQWVQLPVPPVEAVIALSIVFLASEIAKDNRQTLTWRYPISVSSSFGLLHGFGFAAALADIGLPQTELMTGLLFFNLGVEIGQVIFAAAALCGIAGLRYLLKTVLSHSENSRAMQQVSAYTIGGLASFWLIERCASFIL